MALKYFPDAELISAPSHCYKDVWFFQYADANLRGWLEHESEMHNGKKSGSKQPKNVHLQLALFCRKMGLWAVQKKHCAQFVDFCKENKWKWVTSNYSLVSKKKLSAAVCALTWASCLIPCSHSALCREEIRALEHLFKSNFLKVLLVDVFPYFADYCDTYRAMGVYFQSVDICSLVS